jgi:L-asparaginase II
VTRGGLVESRHEIAACAADAGGRIVLAYGDVERPVYVRSAAKPFIAAALVRTGTADRFGFGARELATIAASHNGEPAHVKVVEGILATIGLSAADLQCGAHAPAFEPAAQELAARGEPYTALHNNCSGKHAGILAMCVHLGLDHRGYLAAGHAVQQTILSFCARMVDEDVARLTLGIDGCGIPVFATPLYRAARAFARLATLEGLDEQDRVALVRVREAMTAEPSREPGGSTRRSCKRRRDASSARPAPKACTATRSWASVSASRSKFSTALAGRPRPPSSPCSRRSVLSAPRSALLSRGLPPPMFETWRAGWSAASR